MVTQWWGHLFHERQAGRDKTDLGSKLDDGRQRALLVPPQERANERETFGVREQLPERQPGQRPPERCCTLLED